MRRPAKESPGEPAYYPAQTLCLLLDLPSLSPEVHLASGRDQSSHLPTTNGAHPSALGLIFGHIPFNLSFNISK